jgi:hypothetical protein
MQVTGQGKGASQHYQDPRAKQKQDHKNSRMLLQEKANSDNGKNTQGKTEGLDPLPFIMGGLSTKLSEPRRTGQDQRSDEDPPELRRKPGGFEDA